MILVDCSRASKGGGLQHVIAFLIEVNIHNDHHLFHFVISRKVRSRIYADVSCLPKFSITWINPNPLVSSFYCFFRQFSSPSVLILGGPQYWLPFRRSLATYAIPHYLYSYRSFSAVINSNGSLLASLHSRLRYYLLRRLHLSLFQLNDELIVQTEYVKSKLACLLPHKTIHVIPNCINPALQSNFISSTCQYSGLQYVLVPSAYYPHKNLDLLHSLEPFLVTNSIFLVFTFSLDQLPVLSPLRRTQNCLFAGSQNFEGLHTLYKNSLFVLQPSVLECFSAVLLESFHFLKPLILADLEFNREVVGDSCYYFLPLSSTSLCNTFLQCINDVTDNCAKELKVVSRYLISPSTKYTLLRSLLTP